MDRLIIRKAHYISELSYGCFLCLREKVFVTLNLFQGHITLPKLPYSTKNFSIPLPKDVVISNIYTAFNKKRHL